MINTPKELSDIEVGLYKSGYLSCEKLLHEEHITIAAAVEKTAAKFGGLNMISDMECFKKFLFSEVTAYTEPSSAQSLLPAVRAVDGGFNAGGCGAF